MTENTLADFPELLPNSRVEKLWDRLRKELNLPDSVEFATYEQPPQWFDNKVNGLRMLQPAQAFFLVVSPNPHPRYQSQIIKSWAMCPIEGWKEAEKEAGHYVGAGDPAYGIFKSLCRQHLAARKNWEELN